MAIDASTLAAMQTTLESKGVGELIGIFFQINSDEFSNRYHNAAFKEEEHRYPNWSEWEHFLADNMNKFDICEW